MYDLDVNAFNPLSLWSMRNPPSPYIDADWGGWIQEHINGNIESEYTFEPLGDVGEIGPVVLQVFARNMLYTEGLAGFVAYLWDGEEWRAAGELLYSGLAWSWKEIDVTHILPTRRRVNFAKMKLVKSSPVPPPVYIPIRVDHARLRVTTSDESPDEARVSFGKHAARVSRCARGL